VTNLPARPRGKYGKTLAWLYTLVGKTSGRAQGVLERVEELVALRATRLVVGGTSSEAPRALTRTSLRHAYLDNAPNSPLSLVFNELSCRKPTPCCRHLCGESWLFVRNGTSERRNLAQLIHFQARREGVLPVRL
jgi:hypothetical protein